MLKSILKGKLFKREINREVDDSQVLLYEN